MNVECVSSAQTWKLIRVYKKTDGDKYTPELKESLLEVAQILNLQQNFMFYGYLHLLPVLQWNGLDQITSDMRIS